MIAEKGVRPADPILGLCDEFDIRIISKNRYPGSGETRAAKTMERILAKRGEGHLRLVLSTLTETRSNMALLDEVVLWAASDLALACSPLVEKRTSEWLELWDAMPVGNLQFLAQRLNGVVSQRAALAGMLAERIYRRFGRDAFA